MRRIVVDAMGGDHAPAHPVQGAARASLDLEGTSLLLVGDGDAVRTELDRCEHAAGRIEIEHASQVIDMHEKPGAAIEQKPDSSISVASRLVAEGRGDALVSAGNTGALVLACARSWQLFPGVRKAGFAAVFPTETRRGESEDPFSLILDVGATLNATADELVDFAVLGSAYAHVISRNPQPRVALLSNGHEANKGPPEVVRAHELLTQVPSINFIGNIEGLDIPKGHADVIVCSGFIGNVVIKMLEGVAGTVTDLARYAYKEHLLWRVGLALLSGGIRRLKRVTDWRQYGGAPLLGFNDIMIKAHGRSHAPAITNAIRVADKALSSHLDSLVVQSLMELESAQATLDQTTPVSLS